MDCGDCVPLLSYQVEDLEKYIETLRSSLAVAKQALRRKRSPETPERKGIEAQGAESVSQERKELRAIAVGTSEAKHRRHDDNNDSCSSSVSDESSDDQVSSYTKDSPLAAIAARRQKDPVTFTRHDQGLARSKESLQTDTDQPILTGQEEEWQQDLPSIGRAVEIDGGHRRPPSWRKRHAVNIDERHDGSSHARYATTTDSYNEGETSSTLRSTGTKNLEAVRNLLLLELRSLREGDRPLNRTVNSRRISDEVYLDEEERRQTAALLEESRRKKAYPEDSYLQDRLLRSLRDRTETQLSRQAFLSRRMDDDRLLRHLLRERGLQHDDLPSTSDRTTDTTAELRTARPTDSVFDTANGRTHHLYNDMVSPHRDSYEDHLRIGTERSGSRRLLPSEKKSLLLRSISGRESASSRNNTESLLRSSYGRGNVDDPPRLDRAASTGAATSLSTNRELGQALLDLHKKEQLLQSKKRKYLEQSSAQIAADQHQLIRQNDDGTAKPLSLTHDQQYLSDSHIQLRKCLEFFEAGNEETKSSAQGRRKRIRLGQLGVRCKFCAHLPLWVRGPGAVYYPTKLEGVYQSAQSMSTPHLLEHCTLIPDRIRADLKERHAVKDRMRGSKMYWIEGCKSLNIVERDNCLWFDDSDKKVSSEEVKTNSSSQ